ncbi:MAG: choice-of-anchor Q domain-containing protein [Cyanobacteria bacterium P01_G01_bin.67]
MNREVNQSESKSLEQQNIVLDIQNEDSETSIQTSSTHLIVSTLEDENDGDLSPGDLSLREAIIHSSVGSNISFDSNLAKGVINLTQGELKIDKSLNILGLGANNTVIDAGGNSRVFNIDDGNADHQLDVTLESLAVTGGNVTSFSPTPPANPNDGGGILNAENLEINHADIYNNSAFFSGGGIAHSEGILTVNNSAIYNNSASGAALGTQGGGIINNSRAIINQSTISNNDTGSRSTGSGISNQGSLNVSNSTISSNFSNGILNNGDATMTSSIVAGNGDNNDLEGNDFTSGGNNLIGGKSLRVEVNSAGGFTDGQNGDIVGTGENPIDPQLGELQNNGGATATQSLQSGSPAIDQGSNPSNLATDQRGEGFERTVGAGTDIGAFEVQDGDGGNPTELVVSTLEDENDGDLSIGDLSLREAILNAESGSTITFDSELANGTINLALGELVIDKSLTIQGLGAKNTVIDAGGNSRVFNVNDGNTDTLLDVKLNDLAITGSGGTFTPVNPVPTRGGGIWNSENLEVNHANIYDNFAVFSGGGIYSDGDLTVNYSAIYDNVTNSSDRTASGGGITNAGTAIINQSTISSNEVGGRTGAGGIENKAGKLFVTNSTVDGNDRGGISNEGGAVEVTSSIIAGNANNNDVFGADFVSGGNNLIGGENPSDVSAGGFVDGENGDLVGTADKPIDPQLGALQDNGGATFTQALQSSSPAIDAGSNPNNFATDQRGEGFERTVGAGTDIGAFEVQDGDGGNPTELVVSTLEDENDGDFSAGDLSLREAIILANQNEGADTINFDSSLDGGTITFAQSQERNLTIDESLAIAGLGQDNLTIDGGFIFNIAQPDVDVAIEGLNITGGKIDSFGNLNLTNSSLRQTIATGSDNSAIISRGITQITNSTISDNSGGSNVGILVESGTTSITGSAIANNQADQAQAGIIVGNEATVNVVNSTIANNQGRSIAGIENRGRLNVFSSTVANNSGGLSGGGIVNFAQANLGSTIAAQNSSGESLGDLLGNGEFVSSGNNLIGNGDSVIDFINGENGDIVGTTDAPIDPQLGELQNNGGATATQALQSGSPAIDQGSNPSNLATDQRGEGFERTVGAGTDIGAFEVQSPQNGSAEIVSSQAIASNLEPNLFTLTNGADSLTGSDQSDLAQGIDPIDTLASSGESQDHNVFAIGVGEDTIFDFQDGIDKILLSGSLESTLFADLAIFAVDRGVGIGTNSKPSQTVATIVGVSPDQITQDDFVSIELSNASFSIDA